MRISTAEYSKLQHHPYGPSNGLCYCTRVPDSACPSGASALPFKRAIRYSAPGIPAASKYIPSSPPPPGSRTHCHRVLQERDTETLIAWSDSSWSLGGHAEHPQDREPRQPVRHASFDPRRAHRSSQPTDSAASNGNSLWFASHNQDIPAGSSKNSSLVASFVPPAAGPPLATAPGRIVQRLPIASMARARGLKPDSRTRMNCVLTFALNQATLISICSTGRCCGQRLGRVGHSRYFC